MRLDNEKKIILTGTCGRRPNYFRQVMRSFEKFFLDREMIKDYIFIDDNTDKKELEKLRNEFQYIKFLENKKGGQLNGLKMLLNLDTDYLVHIEDDFIFLKPRNYIKKSFQIMMINQKIKQVTFRNWNTTRIIDSGLEYGMHVFSPMEKIEWDIIKQNDCTYPGLTFNPSVVDYKVFCQCIEPIQQENMESRKWDKQVARIFWNFGYRRANFIEQVIFHIGKESLYKGCI